MRDCFRQSYRKGSNVLQVQSTLAPGKPVASQEIIALVPMEGRGSSAGLPVPAAEGWE